MNSTPEIIAAPVSAGARLASPYVERLTIRNYRGIAYCEIELEPLLTVLAGRNNAGKSRIISALQLGLGGRPAEVDDFSVGIEQSPEIDLVISPGVPSSPERVTSP